MIVCVRHACRDPLAIHLRCEILIHATQLATSFVSLMASTQTTL